MLEKDWLSGAKLAPNSHIDAPVTAHLLPREQGNTFLGVLRLNKPKALNALDLEMVQVLTGFLSEWQKDVSVSAVLLLGEGEKAFCAGGDVVSMHRAMQEQREQENLAPNDTLDKAPGFIQDFFTQEYQLDYFISQYPKPIVCWGTGIVMGGGLGLFAAAKHAIVTETSHIAMPEITIGLFPDVGGSYFLNKMPTGMGLFLGLTGASINAKDALFLGLAKHVLHSSALPQLVEHLLRSPQLADQDVSAILDDLQVSPESQSPELEALSGKLPPFKDAFASFADLNGVQDIEQVLKEIASQHEDNVWLQKALKGLQRGSPITAHLVVEQLRRGRDLSLAACFQQEINIAVSCSMHGEFQEGVRALLIDKDRQAKWRYKGWGDVPESFIASHFTYFDVSENPLLHIDSVLTAN